MRKIFQTQTILHRYEERQNRRRITSYEDSENSQEEQI